MSRYYLRRKKKQFQEFSLSRQGKRFPTRSHLSKESPKPDKYIKNHEHPYATRSKTSHQPSLLFNGNKHVSKKAAPDPNVIYLGAYRKIPRFIDLENNQEEPQHIVLIEKFKPNFQFKVEKMDCQHDDES
ncbi:uncharacterized protein LOC107040011 [Diachasma alloeum]|uniref:uncharacterized protein LOC107040011 n=1 Tax=Diachasma alloeum TaxID=454923 RepID=UPI0007383ACF|nr:uncharacterized protein LOC107040011 [Diachasma alloeum]